MPSTDDAVMPRASSRQLSRRSVMKAGAHAAWIVPAVQVVGAAPAFASCSTTAKDRAFSFSGGYAWNEQSPGKWVLTLTYTITNTSGCPVTGLSVLLTAPSKWGGVQDHSTDKAYNAKKVGGGQNSDTWSFTAVPTGPNTWTLVAKIQLSKNQKESGTITLLATSGDYSGSTAVVVQG
jgi:hypothetical protein